MERLMVTYGEVNTIIDPFSFFSYTGTKIVNWDSSQKERKKIKQNTKDQKI